MKRLLLFLLTAQLAGCGAEPPPAPPERPRNLVLITLDTTRADALGAYGQQRTVSPAFDWATAEGVLFEHATTTNPETLPSHASILTGRWPFRHGVRGNTAYVLDEEVPTLAEHLSKRGYATGVEIAAMVLRERTGITRGFRHYQGVESPGVRPMQTRDGGVVVEQPIRLGQDISASALRFIGQHTEKPFFLWLHYFDAHQPYTAPARFSQVAPDSPYHAGIAYQDEQVGRVISEIRRKGLAKDTLVVITADHGEGLGQHDEDLHAYFVYETTMHVPLVLWAPGLLPAGQRVAQPVRTIDIVPTVLDLLEQDPIAGVDGVSLRPLIEGPAHPASLPAYGEATHFLSTFGLPPLRMLRAGPWKYIHKVNPELYDLARDPAEEQNLAEREAAVAERMRADLARIVETGPEGSATFAPVDPETRAALAALGYDTSGPSDETLAQLDSLVLQGDDPNSHVEDIRVLARVPSAVRYQRFEEAARDLAPLIERYPDNPKVMALQVGILVGLERDDEARPVLDRLMALDPNSMDARIALSTVYKRAEQYDEALEVLRSLVASDPCAKRAQLRLNQLLYDLGRHRAQFEAAETASKECPGMDVNLNNHAWLLATSPLDELRDGPRAVEMIEGVLRGGSPHPSFLDTLAAALAEAGRFDEAQQVQDQVLQLMRGGGAPEAALLRAERRLQAYRAERPVRDPEQAS